MSAPEQTAESAWWCPSCPVWDPKSSLAPAPAIDAICTKCGRMADPCAVTLRTLQEWRAQLEAERQSGSALAAATSDPTAPPVDDAMDAKAAAEFLRLPSEKALYAAVKRLQVPVVRFGRRLRFSRRALEGLVSKRA